MSVNPRFYKGPLPQKEKVTIKSTTWKAGAFCRQTDSGWVKCLANASQINGLFAENQAAAIATGSKGWIHRITSPETLFVGCVTEAGTDTKCPSGKVGANWGLGVNDSIHTVSIGNDSTEILHIYNLLSDLEGEFNDTSDVPGKVIFGIVASALTAEGAGL